MRKKHHNSPELTEQFVHLWPVRVEASFDVVDTFALLLEPEEKSRADRFCSEEHRRSFILVRGTLKALLGHYLGVPASGVRLDYSSNGKPRPAPRSCITFNLSHSGDLVAFTFGIGIEMGVDVERIRWLADMLEIARHFFSHQEAVDLMALPAEQRERAFFRCWTRKEAYLKAIGNGLSVPLNSFDVSVRPGEPARMIRIGCDNIAASAWTLHDLELEPGYAGAIAYRDIQRILYIAPLLNPSSFLEWF